MTTYEVRVRGHLDDHWGDWLGGFTLDRRDDGTTSLVGDVTDQAQLHGVLSALRDVGVELLALQERPDPHPRPEDPS